MNKYILGKKSDVFEHRGWGKNSRMFKILTSRLVIYIQARKERWQITRPRIVE